MKCILWAIVLRMMANGATGEDMETRKCRMHVSVGDHIHGVLNIELFEKIVPKTTKNFIGLCHGFEKTDGTVLKYPGTPFHKIETGSIIQGGDVTHFNGRGGESIYGRYFEDENFTLHFDKKHLLAMANGGPHTNRSQFFITLDTPHHRDGKNVVFGRVVDSDAIIQSMEAVGTEEGVTTQKVLITECRCEM